MSDSQGQLDSEDIASILKYLDVPGPSLPLPSIPFLTTYLPILPTSLLLPFSKITTPRQRSGIPAIKSRRLLYANTIPTPSHLTAEYGRLRWPLLWERLGGARLPPPSGDVQEEEDWVRESFLSGPESSQHVKKLGGFLRGLQEEREMEGVVDAKRVERRLDQGEEFDSESDEEDGVAEPSRNGMITASAANGRLPVGGVPENEDQDEVRMLFEKRLLELFVDGLDTIPYDEIDFTESPDGDLIVNRDEEEKYFDEEEPSRTPNGHEEGKGQGLVDDISARSEMQNSSEEYDY